MLIRPWMSNHIPQKWSIALHIRTILLVNLCWKKGVTQSMIKKYAISTITVLCNWLSKIAPSDMDIWAYQVNRLSSLEKKRACNLSGKWFPNNAWGYDIDIYPMLRADSCFWLVNNCEIWSRISRLTSSAWDIKTKERHWWSHNGDSVRHPLSLPLRYDLVTQLRKRFRMSQILFEHGINSLSLVCFRGYGNLSILSIAIPRLAFGHQWYCDAACG